VTTTLRSLRSPGLRTTFFVGAGLMLIASGVASVWKGEFMYTNYWGGQVFGPLAIMLGAAMLLIVVSRLRRQIVAPFGSHKEAQPARRARRHQKRHRKRKRYGA
jgi:hypothetical protein